MVTEPIDKIVIDNNGYGGELEVKLLEEVSAVYTVEVSVSYQMSGEVEGGVRIVMGNPDNQILVQQNYSTDRKSIAYFSTDGLVIEKYKGFDLISGVKFGVNGIQFYEKELGWRNVELTVI